MTWKGRWKQGISPPTRQTLRSRFFVRGIYLLCNLFGIQCMLRALLIFVLGTKYTHPFSETQGLPSPRAGCAPRLSDHTKGALSLLAGPHTQALGSRVRLQGPSAPPPRVPSPGSGAHPSSSAGSRKTRSEPARAGGACSVASRFSLLVGSSCATPAAAAVAAAAAEATAERPGYQAVTSGPFPSPPDPCTPLRPALGLSFEFPRRRAGATGPSVHPRAVSRRARPCRGAQPRRRAARSGTGGLPRGGGAGCRRRRRRAALALGERRACRVGVRPRASPPRLLASASRAARRPEGAGLCAGCGPSPRREPPPLRPPRGTPQAPCRRSSCPTSFSARRTRPSGGGCWCLR